MEKKSSNKNLHKASIAKKDEFYTQLVDIDCITKALDALIKELMK